MCVEILLALRDCWCLIVITNTNIVKLTSYNFCICTRDAEIANVDLPALQ